MHGLPFVYEVEKEFFHLIITQGEQKWRNQVRPFSLEMYSLFLWGKSATKSRLVFLNRSFSIEPMLLSKLKCQRQKTMNMRINFKNSHFILCFPTEPFGIRNRLSTINLFHVVKIVL